MTIFINEQQMFDVLYGKAIRILSEDELFLIVTLYITNRGIYIESL